VVLALVRYLAATPGWARK